jgi:hypothetical protein
LIGGYCEEEECGLQAEEASQAQIPTSKCPKAIARAVAIEAVVEKEQALNFPSPPDASAKETHFSNADNECICTSYVEVSEDEVIEANRTGVDF